MGFIEELNWRKMLFDKTPGAEEKLASGPQVGYIGFDPTAPSLTIGNYVQIMLLKLWQNAGHTPIILMGGATGRIGDPSGKDKERVLKSYEELDANLAKQLKQAEKFLNFSDIPNRAIVRNNLDFYKDMNVLSFLRDIGKTLTVNYMMSKDSVKNRLETGLSFTEFSYQLLQAYDFQYLYQNDNCHFQMGGSDQWGNITSGTEFIRKNTEDGKVYAITTPLLTKSDGKKFGKSEKGNLWLDPEMTSPYDFYQFWVNCDDADLPAFTRYFTLCSKEEIEAREKEHEGNPNALKQLLAEEITTRVHSKEAFEAAKQVSQLLFSKKVSKDMLLSLTEDQFQIISREIKAFEVPISLIQNGVPIMDLMAEHTEISGSKGEAKRAINNNAVSINKEKISSDTLSINSEHLLKGKYIMLDNGKKNKFIVSAK